MLGCHVIASDLPAVEELADQGVSRFPINSQVALKQLVLRAAATPGREEVGRMAPFAWHDSPRNFLLWGKLRWIKTRMGSRHLLVAPSHRGFECSSPTNR